MKQRLLFTNALVTTAYHWHAGEITVEGEFHASPDGLAAFSKYLRRHKSTSIFSLLVDVPDEGFHSEKIPHLYGGDRTTVIKRKLGQHYYGTPLSTAISLGREKIGRRDEKLLLIALTRPQQFDGWLNTISENKIHLSGLFTIPLIDIGVKKDDNTIFISITSAGLRQTFYRRGQLQFSRLATLENTDNLGTAIAVESAKLFQYLMTQRLIDQDAKAAVKILAHRADFNNIIEQCKDSADLTFHIINLEEKAKSCKLKTALTNSNSELLFLHCLIKKQPRYQLAPEQYREDFNTWNLRVTINKASAMIALACVVWLGKQWLETWYLGNNTLEINAITANEKQKYDASLSTLPKTPFSTEELRIIVDKFNYLERVSPSLYTSYRTISEAVTSSPKIELDSINWRVGKETEDKQNDQVYVIIELAGNLPINMVNDHRAMLEGINAFVDKLKNPGKNQVKILSMPFDVESGKTLKSDSEATNEIQAPNFTVQIIEKL